MTELPTAYVVLKEHLKQTSQKVEALQDIQRSVDSQVTVTRSCVAEYLR